MNKIALVSLALSTLFGCDPEAPEAQISVHADEARSRPPRRDAEVAIGDTVTGTFSYDKQRDTYVFTMPADGSVLIDNIVLGTQRGLDSFISLHGPADAFGKFPKTALASDDNSGVGRLAKLGPVALTAGEYQFAVTTKDDRGRGTYRVELTCASASCEASSTSTSTNTGTALETSTDTE